MDATQATPQKNFKPWTSNLILAGYGAISVVMAYHFLFKRDYLSEFAGALVLCGGFTVYQWSQFMRRSHGQRVEKKALADLAKVIDRRSDASMNAGVVLASGGDADAVVMLRDTKFNIEIKAIQNPGRVNRRHVAQAAQAGRLLHSAPVIWLPRAVGGRVTTKSGVSVFAGDAKALTSFLQKLA